MHEALKVSGMILIANDQASKVKQPRKEALYFPAPFVAAQSSSVLSARVSIGSVGGDDFGPELLPDLPIPPAAVVGFVPDQSCRPLGHHAFFQGAFHQLHFSRRSAFCPHGERKPMTVCHTDDLGALAPLGFPPPE